MSGKHLSFKTSSSNLFICPAMQRITLLACFLLSILLVNCDGNEIIPFAADPVMEDPVDSMATDTLAFGTIEIMAPDGSVLTMQGFGISYLQSSNDEVTILFSTLEFILDCNDLNSGFSGASQDPSFEFSGGFSLPSLAALSTSDEWEFIPAFYSSLNANGVPESTYTSQEISNNCLATELVVSQIDEERFVGSFTSFFFDDSRLPSPTPNDPSSICSAPGAYGIATVRWNIPMETCW